MDKIIPDKLNNTSLENDFRSNLRREGADFIYIADISHLNEKQNKGYSRAVLIGITLSCQYIEEVSETTDYVKKMVHNHQISNDEFHQKEMDADKLADYAAVYLKSRGYSAYSQSERNIIYSGFFDDDTKSTPLPHKTIASLTGLGWIGRNNLLVTHEFGCAICISSVLTDAPMETILYTSHEVLCGDCTTCKDVCSVNAIKGKTWNVNTSRDEIVDVYICDTCLECLIFCPWTQSYMKKGLSK